MAIEKVPIPDEKAKQKKPMKLEVSGIEAWPGQRFTVTLDWNSRMERWVVTITHLNTGKEFFNGVASLIREMSLKPYIHFMFLDPSRQADEVTPSNLGDNVILGIFRGSGVEE